MNQEYIGSELELFMEADVWKKYWFNEISPYIGENILDVGAGIGSTASLLFGKSIAYYTALEPDVKNIEKIKKNKTLNRLSGRSKCINGGITSIEKSALFDTILYIDVLEHIKNDKGELEEAAKHLLPGGKIIVLSPAHEFLYSPFDNAVGHYRRYNKSSLSSIRPSTLSVERLFYLDSIGILASAVNRFFLRSKNPNKRQIKFWNTYMVPISVKVDRIISHRVGKTIVGIFIKNNSLEK